MQEIVNFTPLLELVCAGRKYFLRLVAPLWVVFLLAGCSGLGDLPVTEESYRNWAEHRVQLSKINSWGIHARAAIFAEQEVYQVGINWQREINQFVIVIEAPFGQGVFRVESNLETDGAPPVKLSMPDGQVYYDDSVEVLLMKVLGWSIPVKGLESWIKGVPMTNTEYTFDLRADGRLKSLRQDGWSIKYVDYFTRDTETRGLPRKMYLKHASLALKVVVERWRQFQPEVISPVLFPDFD